MTDKRVQEDHKLLTSDNHNLISISQAEALEDTHTIRNNSIAILNRKWLTALEYTANTPVESRVLSV